MPTTIFDELLMSILGIPELQRQQIRYIIGKYNVDVKSVLAAAMDAYYSAVLKKEQQEQEQEKTIVYVGPESKPYYTGPTEKSRYRPESKFAPESPYD